MAEKEPLFGHIDIF